MSAYYNEIDPYAAQWLRNLIAACHIAPGEVDERSIEDVRPDDLRGFTQCHFFAGIGVWSLALRRAGWSDDRFIWSGSCPCQPFSQAGKGEGFADTRHLWPDWYWLIEQCRPTVIVGEQVASKAVDPWLDTVQADLEVLGFAVGAVAFPSAGVGAPHIRDRTYFVAHTDNARSQRWKRVSERTAERVIGSGGLAGGLADANGGNTGAEGLQRSGEHGQFAQDGRIERIESAGPTNGFWRDADWLFCRDEKWRPVIATHVKVVDEPAASLVRVCAGQDFEEEKGEINDEILSNVSPIRCNGKASVRDVRSDGQETAGPSQGPQPVEQRPVELDDVVYLLPSSLSLAELHGDRRTAEALRILQRTISEAGMVLYPHLTIQEVWASIGEEAKDRIRLGFDASRWQKLVAFPLERGAKNRVGRLRAYGNAINAEAARVFIETVMECI